MKSLYFFAGIWASSLTAGKSLWSTTPASFEDIIRQSYPVGNGRLGAMPFGPPGAEKVVLNIDSLWSGGPFQSSNYSGGNPESSVNQYLPGIRDWIFRNGTGNVSHLLGNNLYYGSYQVYANLSVAIDGVVSATNYTRSLDFETGLHTTKYAANDGNTYTITTYCSYPDQICVYDLISSNTLPKITVTLENQLTTSPCQIKCANQTVFLDGVTQEGPPKGTQYAGAARVIGNSVTRCNGPSMVVSPTSNKISFVIAGDTNYNQKAGNAASNFSFTGKDPRPLVQATVSVAVTKSESAIKESHILDYQSLASTFELYLPDTAGSAGIETSTLIGRYNSSGTGDPYLELTLFELGRHLFISSSRDNSLPPNLAGRWSETISAAWGADYHSNINFQMNHWGTDQTGLGALQAAAWNYMEDTWVPRGTETAELLYGAPGWVTHDEMNIFGHTGMKDTAQWANYPASAVWMMQHVFDHFSYSQDTVWLRAQGYPLLKGVAKFWLSQLQYDTFSNDGTVVVNPCNSPEHGPTTFACTHYQQMIHQLFDSIIASQPFLTESDTAFVTNITTTLQILDKGLHIGTWNEIKEWKIPDSFNYDVQNDTHRHLSNLVGWFPGYSLSSFHSGYLNATIQDAVRTTLISRGPGNGPDANAGWEKVWRAACWARLNDSETAYGELKYAIEQNFASNGLSMYSGSSPPFQIDANFGMVGAILGLLVVDLPLEHGVEGLRKVILGPAIPKTWGNGKVKGLRLRGGGIVDFEWDENGVVMKAEVRGGKYGVTIVNKIGIILANI